MRITDYGTRVSAYSGITYLVKEKETEYIGLERTAGLKKPEMVDSIMREVYHLHLMAEEYLYLICCNTKNIPIGVFEVSHGSVDESIAEPSDILKRALLCGARKIFMVHNHPSGMEAPSGADYSFTERLLKACRLLSMELIDHVIIGRNGYYSFAENGVLDKS